MSLKGRKENMSGWIFMWLLLFVSFELETTRKVEVV